MDDNKIKYRKYLDEIFQEDDDFYYINLSTKEIYPQYKVIVNWDPRTRPRPVI